MSLRTALIFLFLSLCALACKSPDFINDENDWVLLGGKKVNHLYEKDVFDVKRRDKFTAIRLYTSERNITIKELEIMLINGDILKPSIEPTILRNERSRVIEIAADGRQLEKITIVYRSAGKLFSRKGKVHIGGRLHNPNINY